MSAGLSHRLRSHHLREESRHYDNSSERAKRFYASIGIESGWTDRYLVCSCGTEWLATLIDPLRNEWKWYRQNPPMTSRRESCSAPTEQWETM